MTSRNKEGSANLSWQTEVYFGYTTATLSLTANTPTNVSISEKKILFLTTLPLNEIEVEWHRDQNWSLPHALVKHGASVTIQCWHDKTLDMEKLAVFDVITFLWCYGYDRYPIEFPKFIKGKLLPAQNLRPALKVLNHPSVILWNTDKAQYLKDLHDAGFLVPKFNSVPDCSTFPSTETLAQHISTLTRRITNGSVVLKPSISASSKQTHCIKDPSNLTECDFKFIEELILRGIDGSLIIQAFEPAITNGEYSLVFIAGSHTHTMVKVPAQGDFRSQQEFGGHIEELTMDRVPEQAKETAEKIMRFLNSKVGVVTYCRLDGVLRNTGEFVVMEVEVIEPELWVETCRDPSVRETFCRAFLGTTTDSL